MENLWMKPKSSAKDLPEQMSKTMIKHDQDPIRNKIELRDNE